MIGKFAEAVIKYRFLVLLFSAAIIFGGASGLKKLYFDSSTDLWFLKDDPVLTIYQDLKGKFGSDDYLAVGIQAGENQKDVLNPETMIAIKKITNFLEEHVAVNKVRSLSKYEYIFYRDDLLDVELAVPDSDEFNYSEEQWNNIRNILRGENLVHDLLFTKDFKNTIVSARVVKQEDYTGKGNPKTDLAADFRVFLEKEGLNNKDYKIYLSGSSIISESFFHFSTMDQSVSYPLMMLLILVFLYITFRTWMGVILPFIILVVSSIVTLGFIGHLGWSMNMLNMIIPTMLTVIIIAETIHVLVGFYENRQEGHDPKKSAVESLKKYFKPCFYTSITTIFGFASLASSQLALVVEFGMAMVIGVAISFIFSLITLPAILSYTTIRGKKADRLLTEGIVARTVNSLPEKIYPIRKTILWVTFGSLIPLAYLCSLIQVDTNFVRNFKEDTPIRHGLQHFDETYKGALSLEFVLDSGKDEGIKEPQFLKRALEFQNYVTSLEGNGKATSPINYLMKINQIMNDNDPAHFEVPETRNMVGQYLLLYSNSAPDEDLTDLMTFSGREMRISVLFAVAPSKITKERVQVIEKHIAENFSDLNIKVTGRAVLFNNMDNYVLEGLTSSFILAFITISICFFVIFRSVKYGIIALIPNAFPILMAGAVMGIFGIYLDFATLMVASTTLGIAVDDTIHVMNRFNIAKKNNLNNRDAITLATKESGVALVSTTTVLVIGFAMLMLSSFVPNIYMGVLGCITIALAVLCDLVILPALLMSIGEKEEATNKYSPSENITFTPESSQ